jgi:quinol---cytochrome-c reductase cytochrome c subunit
MELSAIGVSRSARRRLRSGPARASRRALFTTGMCAVAASLVAAVFFALARPARASGATASTSTTPSASTRAIQTVYLADCAVCHGADGRGTAAGPSLIGVGAASVDYWVSTGRMPLPLGHKGLRIPRQKPKYPPAEEAALVQYVAALTGGGPPIPQVSLSDANVAAGGQLYRLNCAACHAWAGTGGALVAREAPSLHKATPTQIAEAIRIGPDPMPAFGNAALNDAQVNDVVAYVRALDHPNDRGGIPLGHAGPLAEGAVGIIIGLGALLVVSRMIGTRT